MRQGFRRLSTLCLTLLAMFILLGSTSVYAAGKLDHTEALNVASKTNLIDRVNYSLASDGTVKAQVDLNTAYAGAGRTLWTIYAIIIDGDDISLKKDTFEDKGSSTNVHPTFSVTFKQGIGVVFGAYTDYTEEMSWRDTTDITGELMTNGLVDEIPSLPADPKSTAPTISAPTAKTKKFQQTYTIDKNGRVYLKIKVKKDTRLEWTNVSYSVDGSNPLDLAPTIAFFKTSTAENQEPTRGSTYKKGEVNVLLPGTWWICLYNPLSEAKVNFTIGFNYRYFIPSTGVKWTVDGKVVKDGVAIVKGAGKVKGTLLPSNTDAVFRDADADGISNIKLSKNKKTFTGTLPMTAKSGMSTVMITVYDRNIAGDTNGVVQKGYELEVGRPYSGGSPDVKNGEVNVTHNTFTFDGKVLDSNLYLRIYLKKGSKWVLKYNKPAKATSIVKKLKQNTKYTLKLDYYYKSKKKKIATKATTVNIHTGTSSKPVISSIRVSNVKSSRKWVDGHWIHGTVYNTWQPGYYTTQYSYDVTVTLAKPAPAGTIGLMMTKQNTAYGDPNIKVKGNGTVFTFKNPSVLKSFDATFQFYSDPNYGGYSPASASKKINAG